jgi:hypothetical protein
VVKYRIVDCRAGQTDGQETIVEAASSPEDAARKAIGEVLVRSGRRSDLRARVYYQYPEQPLSMVRLYAKAIDRT